MRTVCFTFLITQLTSALSQVNSGAPCPPGYEIRNVRCNGTITQKCVPSNYSCKLCWMVANPPCEGKTSGGSEWPYSSYEKAIEKAEKGVRENNSCPFYNDQIYTILMDDVQFCQSNNNIGNKFDSKLFESINQSIKNLKQKIDELRRAYDNFPTVDRAEAGLVGYLEFIQRASEAAQTAYDRAIEYQREPLENIEEVLRTIENDLNNYSLEASSKIVHIIAVRSKSKPSEKVIPSQQDENTKQQLAKQKELQDAQIQLQKRLDENNENYRKAVSQLPGAIEDLGNAIANAQENKFRREEQKRQEEEYNRKQKQLNDEMKKLKEKQELEEENYIKEQKRINEEKNIKIWRDKSLTIYNDTVSEYIKPGRLYKLENSKTNSVYYIVWNFTKNNQVIISGPIEIKKSPDGDWVLNSDLIKQLENKTQLNLSTTPDGVIIKNNDLSYMIGYIEDIQEARNICSKLKQNAISKGFQILELNTKEKSNSKEKGYWDE